MSLIIDIKKKIGAFQLDVSLKTGGGVSGLLGASGSGKSMTLMCVAGIVKPDSGKIILNDRVLFDSEKRINLPPQERRVGYLFQNYALFPNMTLRQNIMCGLRNKTNEKSEREKALREIICLTRLNGLENRFPSQLSGGQQQRAALARILVGGPDILLLDEPFSALDHHLRGQLQIEIKKLLELFAKDALIVTHDRDEAYHLCRKIAFIDSGKILVHKDSKQLFADPESRQAALLSGCKNVVAAIKTGEFELEVPEWGVSFTSSEPVKDGLCAVGIRAHYFNPKTVQNRFPIRFLDEMEGPFEYILQFRYENQREDSQNIWWRIPKEKRPNQLPAEFGVAPANIMLLYK